MFPLVCLVCLALIAPLLFFIFPFSYTYEKNVSSARAHARARVRACMLLQEGHHAVCIISCLFMVPNIFGHCREGVRYAEGVNKTKKIKRKGKGGGVVGGGENTMITEAAQISQTHISSIMWISRGDYAWRWQTEGGLITIHHKGCFLISHTLISFCLQIASHSSLFLAHTQTLMCCGVAYIHTHTNLCMKTHKLTHS